MNARRRRLRGQAGFTLIELLVVIIVLGLLVGLVGPRLFQNVGKSKLAAPTIQIACQSATGSRRGANIDSGLRVAGAQ